MKERRICSVQLAFMLLSLHLLAILPPWMLCFGDISGPHPSLFVSVHGYEGLSKIGFPQRLIFIGKEFSQKHYAGSVVSMRKLSFIYYLIAQFPGAFGRYIYGITSSLIWGINAYGWTLGMFGQYGNVEILVFQKWKFSPFTFREQWSQFLTKSVSFKHYPGIYFFVA